LFIMSLLKKYWGILRRQRILHFLNNLANYPRLKDNKSLYKKYGTSKSILGSISHRDFKASAKESPWLDEAGAIDRMLKDVRFQGFSQNVQQSLLTWPDNGFMVLKNFVSGEKADKINNELDLLVKEGKIDFDYTKSRIMNGYKHSNSIKETIENPELLKILGFILNREVIPFQTISFMKGSQQRTHSDSIHMTTEPLGYLLAIWVALEDITMECGPLHYYPGSHQLPYVMSEDFENDNTFFSVGENYYASYENKIASLVTQHGLKKEIFLAKKGDLFIWHANLLHGGEKRIAPESTRKSLVAHYFCKGDIVNYHEITQRPAILK
jgi:ectoine hydroxylase